MQSLNKYLCIGLMVCCISIVYAQNDTIKPFSVPFFSVNYGVNFPAADLNERFGFFNAVGVNVGYKTTSNWQISVDGGALFGNKVNSLQPVQHILNQDSLINGSSGELAQYSIIMRGLSIGATVQKIITINKSIPNSGILLQLGTGYLQHKIRYDDIQSQVPQFQGEYVKLIDRLTGGIYLNQAIGYQYFSNNRLVNFKAVFEMTEGFTKPLRSYNLNAENPTESNGRLDFFYSLKFTWVLPFFKKSTTKRKDQYYYD